MSHFEDRSSNPRQPKGILKKSAHPPVISAEPSAAEKLRNLVELLAQKTESSSVRPRNTHSSVANASRGAQGEKSDDSVSSSDYNAFNRDGDRPILEPVSTISKCQACWKPLGEFQGFILKNCQQHIVCRSCVHHGIQEAYESEEKPTCPVDSCCAKVRKDEVRLILAEDQEDATNRELGSSQKSEKKPASSYCDDSEEIDPTEELLLPRANEEMVVAEGCSCDKCGQIVDRTGYLDIRKCKMHHKICFDCIRATVKISKNLVRCPMYRECKSMMAQDEVAQAKFEVKEEANKQRDSPLKANPKGKKLIYPSGLPSRDLWPVLESTQCNKCGRDINCLNGIVVQECNVHSVCIKCVREKIALNRRKVECPMYLSCKAIMTKDEVRAFISRFGGPVK